MQVYLHIGQGRTGTTTLQSLLMNNREALLRLGYDYPKIGLLHPEQGIAQHQLAFSLLPTWPPASIKAKVDAAEVWGDLGRHIEGMDGPDTKLILSSESFMHVPKEGLAFIQNALRGRDIRVVCVTRDPEDARQSWYSHQVMQGAVIEPPTDPAKDRATPRLNRWSRFFDVTRIAYGTDVVRDVLAFIGIDIAQLDPVPQRNKRLTADHLGLVAKINGIPFAPENLDVIQREILRCVGVIAPDLEAFIAHSVRHQINRATFNERLLDHLRGDFPKEGL